MNMPDYFGGGRPSDAHLVALRDILLEVIDSGRSVPPFPPEGIVLLCNEIIEARALATGVMEPILREGGKPDGEEIHDRPTDANLAALVKTWREIVLKGGPRFVLAFPVLAMLTLAEEVIELRKAPRA